MDVFGTVAEAHGAYLRDAVLRAARELNLAEALPATPAQARETRLRSTARSSYGSLFAPGAHLASA